MRKSRIIVATDFSETSRFAVDYAATHAKMTGAKLLIVHAVAVPSSDEGMGALHTVVDSEDPGVTELRLRAIEPDTTGVEFEHRVLRGEPAAEILGLAEDENAALIVMGTHGRTGLMRMLMGSVAEQVLRKAECPVLTVKVPKTLA
jgi:nucleotide-binding universal stress UspA family protein